MYSFPTLINMKGTIILLLSVFCLLQFSVGQSDINGFNIVVSYSGAGCQGEVTRVIGNWLANTNIASSSCIKSANNNNNINNYSKSTCWVEGSGGSAVIKYKHYSFSDSSCSSNQNVLPGNSALCTNTESDSTKLLCLPYNLHLLQNIQINGNGLVAGFAEFRYDSCDSSFVYYFDVSPVDSCDSFSAPEGKELNKCYWNAKNGKSSVKYFCNTLQGLFSTVGSTAGSSTTMM